MVNRNIFLQLRKRVLHGCYRANLGQIIQMVYAKFIFLLSALVLAFVNQ